MARWSLLAVPLAVLAAGAALAALAAPDAPAEIAVALDAVAAACAEEPDGVCLAYAGAVPGPTIEARVGDFVTVTLRNRIAETIPPGTDPEVAARLAASNVSFHAHGTSTPAELDGVPAHDGTRFVASVAPPGGEFVYRFRAAYAGAWHYHDHALGHDGAEGTLRGLFGALVVRSGAAARPDATFPLHLHDDGPNSGRGFGPAHVAPGASFDLVVVGLGNVVWDVALADPAGATVATLKVGPGMSERVRVADAAPGAYRWTASWGPDSHSGEVTVA